MDPEEILRSWANALNAVADLQHAIVAETEKLEDLGIADQNWLESFRAIVYGTLRTFPDKAKEGDAYSAQGLQHTATEALSLLRETAEEHHRNNV